MARRRSVLRSIRVNLLILGALVGLAALALRIERAVPFLAEHGDALDYAAGVAAGADYDALSTLELFELRRRFRDKLAECTGLTAASRPYWVEEFPGRLMIRGRGERLPLVEIDFAALKSQGPLGRFATAGAQPEAERIRTVAAAAGLLGIYAPDKPCPPTK